MRPGVILVNTARAAMVDEAGHDRGLDVGPHPALPGSTSSISSRCLWIIR